MNIETVLVSTEAFKLAKEPITFASGLRSPVYCDNRKVLSFPKERAVVVKAFAALVKEKFSMVTCVAGVATAGIPWGALVAEKLGMPFAYVRPKPKEHGKGKQVEGVIATDARVVLVEDLVTTGGSSLKALRAVDAEVLGVVAIFSYELKNVLREQGIAYHTLTTFERVVAMMELSNQQRAMLERWHKQPEAW